VQVKTKKGQDDTNVALKVFRVELMLDQLSDIEHHSQACEKLAEFTIRGGGQLLKTLWFLELQIPHPIKGKPI